MALLNMDDASSSPRVLPKVFADVPSTAELRAAEEAAARAKRRASALTIITVLVAGALVAVTAFLMITLTNQSSEINKVLADADKKVAAAQDVQKQEKDRADKLDRDVSQLNVTYAPVAPVADLDGKVEAVKKDIKSKLDLPAYSGARAGIKRAELWNAYEGPFVWGKFDNGDWHTYVITNLSRRLDLLTALNTEIANWKGGAGPGPVKKVCPDNNPNC